MKNELLCKEDLDWLHHVMQEQITYISVKEEEERIRKEMLEEN